MNIIVELSFNIVASSGGNEILNGLYSKQRQGANYPDRLNFYFHGKVNEKIKTRKRDHGDAITDKVSVSFTKLASCVVVRTNVVVVTPSC